MKMVLFENVRPYPVRFPESFKKLIDIEKIVSVRQSGTPEYPTVTLEFYNDSFEFNKITYESLVIECSNLDHVIYAFELIEKERKGKLK